MRPRRAARELIVEAARIQKLPKSLPSVARQFIAIQGLKSSLCRHDAYGVILTSTVQAHCSAKTRHGLGHYRWRQYNGDAFQRSLLHIAAGDSGCSVRYSYGSAFQVELELVRQASGAAQLSTL